MRKAVSKFALTASVVLAMVLTLSCDSSGESSFVGKWVLVDGSASWELLKDGTGIVQEGKENIAISWKVVDKRFVITTTVRGSLVSKALDYKISGNKIIFTDDKGESKTFVKPQKGKAPVEVPLPIPLPPPPSPYDPVKELWNEKPVDDDADKRK